MQISKEKLQLIIDNAPEGSDKVQLIKGLYDRGISVQGVDSYDAQKYFNSYESNKIKQQQAAEDQAQPVVEQQTNLGTGFDPSFESQPDDSVITSVAKTIGNTPKSAYMLGKDVFTAVTNPIDTAKTIVNLAKGLGGKIGEKGLEDTSVGQSLLEKMNEIRLSRGLEPLQRDDAGKLKAQTTEEVQMVNQVGAYFKDRYGSWENFKESSVEDPVGVVSDVASAVSAAGFAVKQTGNVSRVGRLADVGSTIQRVGDTLEPVTAAQRGISGVTSAVSNTLPGRIVGEAAPTPGRFAEGQIVKALDLTQGDVRRITEKTGNEVADFVSRNRLLRETPEETASALTTFNRTQYDLVRSEVARVTNVYEATTVPRVTDALTSVKNIVDDVPGLEDVAVEVNRLLGQESYTLSDVQRVKELLDANTNIFTRSGDVKEAAKAQGLANVRSEIRSFIETEVSKATDGQTNINRLNNDVATARELSDAIETRATRDLTRNYQPLTSTLLGGAAFAGTGDIFVALGVAGISKMAQTPSFRIALARVLNATPAEDLQRWSSEVASQNLSPQTRQALLQVIEEARRNAEFIEAGSQIVNEAQSSEETTELPK